MWLTPVRPIGVTVRPQTRRSLVSKTLTSGTWRDRISSGSKRMDEIDDITRFRPR